MKSSLSRALDKRRDAANRRIISAKEQLQSKESISKGRREIVIEPSCPEVCPFSKNVKNVKVALNLYIGHALHYKIASFQANH